MYAHQGAVISPNKFVYTVQQVAQTKNKLLFTGWSQNDVSEFLLLWMECMHNSISRKIRMKISGIPENNMDQMAVQCYQYLQELYAKDYSELYDLFYGIYMTTIYDKENGKQMSMKAEHFFILDMQLFALKENEAFSNTCLFHDIYSLFDHYVQPEHMYGDNAWYNEAKGVKQEVNKVVTFWNLPTILILSLKRFSMDGNRKLMHLVNFPLENLNLSKYVKGYQSKQYVYDLYGVCNHSGGVQGGHYTAFVKHAQIGWLHFNDTIVTKVEHVEQIISPAAYCLFYRKKDSK
jgi:ubiquitin C-terminal hydrolase